MQAVLTDFPPSVVGCADCGAAVVAVSEENAVPVCVSGYWLELLRRERGHPDPSIVVPSVHSAVTVVKAEFCKLEGHCLDEGGVLDHGVVFARDLPEPVPAEDCFVVSCVAPGFCGTK